MVQQNEEGTNISEHESM